MEPEGSIPRLQVPARCPFPETHPVHASPSHFLKIYLNNLLPSALGSYKWSLSVRFPHQNPVYISPLSHTCYMPRLFHSSLFDNPNNIWWGIQIIKLLIGQFSPLPCYHVPIRPKYFPQHPILQHPQSTSLPNCERPSWTPKQNNKQNLNLYSFRKQTGKKKRDSAPIGSKHFLT